VGRHIKDMTKKCFNVMLKGIARIHTVDGYWYVAIVQKLSIGETEIDFYYMGGMSIYSDNSTNSLLVEKPAEQVKRSYGYNLSMF
jgi:hypothetical protein